MHSTYYRTFTDWITEYKKHIQEIQIQFDYERNIVCSVPVSSIYPVCFDLPATDRCEPG